jgi:hypothetical protein
MTRLGLTGGALVTSVLLASDPVAAQSPSDADKIERLERQVNLLQKQLTALQGEIRQTKKKTEPTQPPRHPQTQQVGEQQVGEETRPAAEPKKTETAAAGRVDFPHGRPTVTSADGGISLAIGEQFQYDVGRYFQAKRSGVFEPPGAQELNNGVNLRRGRVISSARSMRGRHASRPSSAVFRTVRRRSLRPTSITPTARSPPPSAISSPMIRWHARSSRATHYSSSGRASH